MHAIKSVIVTLTSGAGPDGGTAAGASTAALSRRPRVLVSCRHTAHTSPQGMPPDGATNQRPPRLTSPSAQLHQSSPQL